MIRIWFKLIKDERIVKDDIMSFNDNLSLENFVKLTSMACEKFDVPTPVILRSHFQNYAAFNHAVFLPRDFAHDFKFDSLVLENAAE